MIRRQIDTSTRFLLDTAFHRLEIIRDDGLYRHLRMKQPGTSCYYFDIITWPGYLTVTGDMGTWTFSRIADMFDFFGPWQDGINTGYWSEKLEAGAGHSACELLIILMILTMISRTTKTGMMKTILQTVIKPRSVRRSVNYVVAISVMTGKHIRQFITLTGPKVGVRGMSATG